ncbi:MAG: hypothetical protein H8E41_05460 [Desulfobulbaceae bacterium]|uniref:Uncharacterized protein n=1 Tax=Candidatus Desulfobia pelagia TaxID=2841692 RepID=A0A8J6TFF1_9BACT|nr:hypothetical protein [Candidatus Desulfobia pelagia]
MRKEVKGEEGGRKTFTAIAAKKICPIVITARAVFRSVMPAFRKIYGASATDLPGSVRIAAGYG